MIVIVHCRAYYKYILLALPLKSSSDERFKI